MLIATYFSGPFPQCHLDGFRSELLRLVATTGLGGELALDDNESSDGIALKRMTVTVSDSPCPIRIDVDLETRALGVVGDEKALTVFNANIESLINGDGPAHQHVEWFDGNAYVHQESLPLIISVTAKENEA